MSSVNIHYAKTHLSRLINEVSEGKEIVIARAGQPVAKLVPCSKPGRPRKPGRCRGKIRIAADFNELPPEMLASFYGEES
jgi:prevent-host-death family protein